MTPRRELVDNSVAAHRALPLQWSPEDFAMIYNEIDPSVPT